MLAVGAEPSPYSFLSIEEARAHLQRDSGVRDETIAVVLNATLAVMNNRTRRRLADQWYVNPITVASATHTQDDATLTWAGAQTLYERMPARSTKLRPDSVIQVVNSATSVDLSKAAVTSGAVAVTFGNRAERQRHFGGSEILLKQHPVTQVLSVNERDPYDGTLTAVDLTNAFLLEEDGIHQLAATAIAANRTIEVEYRAGYRRPTATDAGHDDWWELRRLQSRLLEIAFTDARLLAGRISGFQMGAQSVQFIDRSLPKEISDGLDHYSREPE